MAKTYKDKEYLRQKYDELGSTRRVGKYFGVANGTIIHWMRKYSLPRIPKLYLYNNNSGKGRLCELYILNHPYFKKYSKDLGDDDKSKTDILWKFDRVNIKSSHRSKPTFSVKKKRHDVAWYICCAYGDFNSNLVPSEIWIIPSKEAPHTGIKPAFIKKGGKYHKYRLSLKRDIEFSSKDEAAYNKRFIKKYSKKK